MLFAPILAGNRDPSWQLTLSADEANVNLKSKLETAFGSMSSAVTAVVTIATGVKIYSTTPGSPAMDSGTGWPSGSTLKIVNLGSILGAGGVGSSYNAAGTVGGDALSIRLNTQIDNTSGYIFGGGGGGGRGGSGRFMDGYGYSDGPGGGGRGKNGGVGGTGDASLGGSNGSSGSEAGPGAGAMGVCQSGAPEPGSGLFAGGAGGDWGSPGDKGSGAPDPWNDPNSAPESTLNFGYYGENGFAGGKAVKKNGKSVTWLGGNNSSRVKGSVS